MFVAMDMKRLYTEYYLFYRSIWSTRSYIFKDMPFQFYKAGHFSPSFSLSHAHIELEPMKSYTTAAKLFNINSVEQYK